MGASMRGTSGKGAVSDVRRELRELPRGTPQNVSARGSVDLVDVRREIREFHLPMCALAGGGVAAYGPRRVP
jgi:hypothetical protein